MLSNLFSGADPDRGRGHAVTAVGDPNQAIYGWRGASVSNILNFAETFPARDGGSVPVLPLTVNRRSDRRILQAPTPWLLRCTTSSRWSRRWSRSRGQPTAGSGCTCSRPRTRSSGWLTEEVRAAHADASTEAWSDIGVLTRDNSTAEAVFDALTGAGIPVEIVGLSGLLGCPRWPRSWRCSSSSTT